MEGHRGPIYYHLISLLVGFAPWSVFLGPVAIHTWRAARRGPSIQEATADAHRFLACWIIVYFAVFSLSATKLPNYILPLYPAAIEQFARENNYAIEWRGPIPAEQSAGV